MAKPKDMLLECRGSYLTSLLQVMISLTSAQTYIVFEPIKKQMVILVKMVRLVNLVRMVILVNLV